MLHCLKLKWMWTEFSVMTLRTEGTLGGRINRLGQRLIPKHRRKECDAVPPGLGLSASLRNDRLPPSPQPPLQKCAPSQSSTHLTHLSLGSHFLVCAAPKGLSKSHSSSEYSNTRLGSLLSGKPPDSPFHPSILRQLLTLCSF